MTTKMASAGAASSALSIPRFLLPQRGLIWRRFASSSSSSSSPNTKKGSKGGPLVLEKPERFNPPSHGTRLPQHKATPRHYGGDLTKEEMSQQRVREYPGLEPPPGTWSNWLLNQRWIHLTLTMGTLLSLALYTAHLNFKLNSPFYDLLPSPSGFFRHPIASARQLADVVRMNEMHNAALVQAKRQRKIDDVDRRAEYRKAHGLSPETGLWGLRRSAPNSTGPTPPARNDPAEDEASPVAAEK